MRHRYVILGLALVLTLGGCGGVALVASAIGLLKVAHLAADLRDTFSGSPDVTLTLLLDGYPVRTDVPNAAGSVDLSGLPQGQFLMSIVTPDRRTGWTEPVTIGSTNTVEVAPITGAVIKGTVMAQSTAGGTIPAANVVVAAFENGAKILASDGAPLVVGGTETRPELLAMTGSDGSFVLGPAAYGDWLVAAFMPGTQADARAVTVGAGKDATGVNLVLAQEPQVALSAINGTVVRDKTGAPLAAALVRADLSTAISPTIPSATQAQVESDTSLVLPAQGWFSYPFVTAESGTTGSYLLSFPAGPARVWAYEYGYQGSYQDVAGTLGGLQRLDFRLADK